MTESTEATLAAHRAALQRGEHLFTLLPFTDVESDDGTLVVELGNRAHLSNTRGALQGGLVATLIDIVAGRLALENVEAGHQVATADMTIHFLAPVVTGPARATATVVRAGRRTVVVAVDVLDVGGDRPAARATLSFAVLPPR